MTLSEFVNEWNIVFELKITLAQAKKPTHSFIFEVLQFFLTNIRIDCVRLKANVISIITTKMQSIRKCKILIEF